jgi:hypothetical protein
MWSDTLRAAEAHDIQRLLIWGGVSAVTGCALLLTGRVRRGNRSRLLFHFSVQMALWGEVELIIGGARWMSLGLRDFAAATRLEHAMQFALCFEIGLVALGVTLVVVGWVAGRRMGGVGAGVAISTHGVALGVLGLPLLAVVSR